VDELRTGPGRAGKSYLPRTRGASNKVVRKQQMTAV
jgi:hypothetical protein